MDYLCYNYLLRIHTGADIVTATTHTHPSAPRTLQAGSFVAILCTSSVLPHTRSTLVACCIRHSSGPVAGSLHVPCATASLQRPFYAKRCQHADVKFYSQSVRRAKTEMLRTRLRAVKVALAICGILVSLYATHVERSKHANPSYQAMCDFSEGASCSRVLTSDASIGFGIVGRLLGDDHPLNLPNTYYGLVVYSLLAVLGECMHHGPSKQGASTPYVSMVFAAGHCLLSKYTLQSTAVTESCESSHFV